MGFQIRNLSQDKNNEEYIVCLIHKKKATKELVIPMYEKTFFHYRICEECILELIRLLN